MMDRLSRIRNRLSGLGGFGRAGKGGELYRPFWSFRHFFWARRQCKKLELFGKRDGLELKIGRSIDLGKKERVQAQVL